ncbi:3'-5' exonuclease [uncultured Roseobacter sp.]|uniref:3'-5' exonuclease n=1 Tax=uncultured Roseobacter sp. TaxID=114847 RepID=UPI00260163AB|nr:3'-5' exonuclease [uncultured Roseobacter sp.]
MFTRLGLRFRVFLFFCFLAVAGTALAAATLTYGWSRTEGSISTTPFVTAFILFAFLNTGLVVAIWLLFDEHVAKPINMLSTSLRLRAHSGVDTTLEPDAAQYLGDLAPAASALTQMMSTSVLDHAAQIAEETQRLRAESERLTALLTEIPIATILLNSAQEIVLYDGQAASVLSRIASPRLKAPFSDYFDTAELSEAMARLSGDTVEVSFALRNTERQARFDAKLRALGNDCHMILIDAEEDQARRIEQRPLVFDFDLMNASEITDIAQTPLPELCFVSFDTETTGLSVEKDAIVQLGAVRVLNGRIVEGEVLDTYVNPGRTIPPASSEIHRVTDADVANAPDIGEVGRSFHQFAKGAVLVAHNAPFDIGLLRASQAQMGVEWTHPVLDTVLLSAVVFGTTEEHSLDVLCDRLAITIPIQMRHTALGDAKATAEALIKLLPLLEAKGILTFGELIQETRRHSRLLHDLNE